MSAQRLLFQIVLLAGVAACVGCGGKPTGDLSGSVQLNGAPLKGGQVTAYDDKGEILARAMVVDGRYELSGLPVGPATLVVQTHTGDGQPITSSKAPPRPGERVPLPIPEKAKKDKDDRSLPDAIVGPQPLDPVPLKYTQQKQSGLQVTVVKGGTVYDITMTGKGEIPRIPKGGGPPVPPPPGGFPPGVPPPPGGFPPKG
jgi:hypothetical protein